MRCPLQKLEEKGKRGGMAEELCFYTKDVLVIKPPKKSPLVLRMIVLAFSMVFGIYICSIILRQSIIRDQVKLTKVEIIKQRCHNSRISPSETPFMHYPVPTTYRRDECACTPVRFFAILSMQRSGSGWFETFLNSHINVSSNGEIFSAKARRSNTSSIMATLDKVYNLDWLSSAAKNECTAAVGFKWMLNQGLMEHHEEIAKYFIRRGVSAVFLFRRNQLRRMVSIIANSHDRFAKQLNGSHKSHVHSKDEAVILARYKPVINTTLLMSDLKHAQRWVADALEYFKSTRHIILYYEDLVSNRTKLIDVQDFLGVPHRKLVSRQVKIHTKPLYEQIENWDAVYKALNGTGYESFLGADYQL
uniref:Sulfotransferase n=1 Tax=Anthurium amnicola TaxID=1678845 RepID=A0A1D1XVW8_9ARAE